MTHAFYVQVGYDWLLKNGRWVAFKELNAATPNCEIPDVIGWRSGECTVLEVKISLSDFYSDRKKLFRQYPELGMGNKRYYLVPVDLIKPGQLPDGWGLIYANDKGKTRIVFDPWKDSWKNGGRQPEVSNLKAELAMMYSALRRLQLKGLLDVIYEDLQKARDEQAEKVQIIAEHDEWCEQQRKINNPNNEPDTG